MLLLIFCKGFQRMKRNFIIVFISVLNSICLLTCSEKCKVISIFLINWTFERVAFIDGLSLT